MVSRLALCVQRTNHSGVRAETSWWRVGANLFARTMAVVLVCPSDDAKSDVKRTAIFGQRVNSVLLVFSSYEPFANVRMFPQPGIV